MGYFEDKFAALGRGIDSVITRAMGRGGSAPPSKLGLRIRDFMAWLDDRAFRLDDSLARRGVRVSTMRIGKCIAGVALLIAVVWPVIHLTRAGMAPPAPAVAPGAEKLSDDLATMIRNKKAAATMEAVRPTPPRNRAGGNGR